MYVSLAKLGRHSLPLFTAPVVRVVDNALTTGVEKVPDELLAAVQNLLAQFHGLRALLPRTCVQWRKRSVQRL